MTPVLVSPKSDSTLRDRLRHTLPVRSHSAILGIGCYVPETVVTNNDLEQSLDTSDQWIRQRTGIVERRILRSDQATSDMAAAAALQACKSAELDPSQVELIVVATMTSDHPMPSTACIVQQKIGAHRAAGFDLAAACTGFVNALMTADALVMSGQFRNALVIGADAMTRIVDPTSRETRVVFADGAGAVVLGHGVGRATLIDHLVGIDGSGAEAIIIPAGGSRLPSSESTVSARQQFIQMRGGEVFRFASEVLPRTVEEIVTRNGYAVDDLALLVPHQANLRILEASAKRLGLPMDRVAVDLDMHGNTGAGSIPLALDRVMRERSIDPGSLICLAGFGAGLSWGASLLRWEG